jgi:hypothetical protein
MFHNLHKLIGRSNFNHIWCMLVSTTALH